MMVLAPSRDAFVDERSTKRPAPREPRLHAGFEAQASHHPSPSCLVDGNVTWTYGEVESRANQVAHHLHQRGVVPGDLVAVLLEKSPSLLVAILGVLKAGAAYLPIDPAIAKGRARWMFDHAQARLIVSETALIGTWNLPASTVLFLADNESAIRRESSVRPASSETALHQLAYAIFTSGSTGQPKLIGVEHAQVANLIDYATRELLDADDLRTVPFIDSISFDSSVHQIFTTLTLGGTLVLQRDLASLLHSPWAERFTSLGTTPSTLATLLDSGALPSSIRVLGLGGESIPPGLVDRIRQLPHLRKALNYYGPTETTIYSTVHWLVDRRQTLQAPDTFPGTSGRILGRPIQNTRIYVLDESQQPAPPGATGEIYIGGAGVARGYLFAPEQTAQRFAPDPLSPEPGARRYRTGDLGRFLPDGTLEFLGRSDTQFKLRGVRLEYEEIEAHLTACPGVRQAAVALQTIQPDRPCLVAYVVADETVTLPSLRAFLAPRVPGVMLPAVLVKLERLPLTTNGKIDRRALPAPPAAPTPPEEAIGSLESMLAQIWCELLGVPSVDQHDDFFKIGGDSLLAVRLMLEIEQKTGRPLPASILIQAPTLAAMALQIAAAENSPPLPSLVPLQPSGQSTPVFWLHDWNGDVQAYVHVARSLAPDRPVYGVRAVGLDGRQPRHQTMEEMATHYAREIRALQPDGPYNLVGHSLGGWIAYATACELIRQGEKINALVLFDTGPHADLDLPLLAKLKMRPLVIAGRQRRKFKRWWRFCRDRLLALASGRPLIAPAPKAPNLVQSIVVRYRPEKYTGNLVVIPCEHTPRYHVGIWKHLTTEPPSVHRLPGSHSSLIDKDHAPGAAALLERVLRSSSSA